MNLQDFIPNSQPKVETAGIVYTEEQLMARLKFFIGICLSLTLFGIVFVVLYSLIFVTQPLNAISPIDQKFFELIIPIATFLTGTLSGIMLAGGDKDAQKMALQAATRPTTGSPSLMTPGAFGSTIMPTPSFGGMSNGYNSPPSGFTNANVPSTGYGSFPGGFSQPTPAFTPQVITGFGGKPAPLQPPQPEL
jgi:hypothetical protein